MYLLNVRLAVKSKTTWPGTLYHRPRETSHLICLVLSRSLLSIHTIERAISCYSSTKKTLSKLLAPHLLCVWLRPLTDPHAPLLNHSWEMTGYPGAVGNAPRVCVPGISSEMAMRTSGELSCSEESGGELKPSLDCSVNSFLTLSTLLISLLLKRPFQMLNLESHLQFKAPPLFFWWTLKPQNKQSLCILNFQHVAFAWKRSQEVFITVSTWLLLPQHLLCSITCLSGNINLFSLST